MRVGGWGHLLGDEGSGYPLALEALRLATQTVDGRADAEALVRAILRHWPLSDAGALIGHVHTPGVTPADIGSLAPLIGTLAASGDAAARALVEQSVTDLARQVDTAIRELALSSAAFSSGDRCVRAFVISDSLPVAYPAVRKSRSS